MKNQTLIYFIPFIFVLAGCSPDYIYEKSQEIQGGEWFYKDTLNFEVEISDTLEIYNLYLDLEHATDYAYQNIYILIYTRFPTGERIKERVNIDFADKSGVWFGDCSKTSCHLRVNIQKGAFFNTSGNYLFTVEQFMRVDPLPAIKQVALRIERTGQKRKSNQ